MLAWKLAADAPALSRRVVAALAPGDDPAPYAEAGATWWVVDFPGDAVSVDQVRGVIRDGPFGGSATPGAPGR